jgi:hypothetical protein
MGTGLRRCDEVDDTTADTGNRLDARCAQSQPTGDDQRIIKEITFPGIFFLVLMPGLGCGFAFRADAVTFLARPSLLRSSRPLPR